MRFITAGLLGGCGGDAEQRNATADPEGQYEHDHTTHWSGDTATDTGEFDSGTEAAESEDVEDEELNLAGTYAGRLTIVIEEPDGTTSDCSGDLTLTLTVEHTVDSTPFPGGFGCGAGPWDLQVYLSGSWTGEAVSVRWWVIARSQINAGDNDAGMYGTTSSASLSGPTLQGKIAGLAPYIGNIPDHTVAGWFSTTRLDSD